MSEYTYSAFISYKHDPDEAIAGVIQDQIEHFWVPAAYRNSPLVEGKHLKKVFRDSTEFAGSYNLEESIKEALSKSAYLIVIISEETKNSSWVEQEIEFFLKDHDRDHILTVLSSGDRPEENYPSLLTEILKEDGSVEKIEPLSVDYRNYQTKLVKKKSKANRMIYTTEFPRIMAPILEVAYDDLVRRQERYRKQRAFVMVNVALALVSIALVYFVWSEIRVNRSYRESLKRQSEILVNDSLEALADNDRLEAIRYALRALPTEDGDKDMPVTPEARYALSQAVGAYIMPENTKNEIPIYRIEHSNGITDFEIDSSGRYVLCSDTYQWLHMEDLKDGRVLYDGSVSDYGRYLGMYVCADEFYVLFYGAKKEELFQITKDGKLVSRLVLSDHTTDGFEYVSSSVLVAEDRFIFLYETGVGSPQSDFSTCTYSPKDGNVEIAHIPMGERQGISFENFRCLPENGGISFSYYGTDDSFQAKEAGVGILKPEEQSVEMYATRPMKIEEYLIDNDRIYYVTGAPESYLSEKGTSYSAYTLMLGCVRKDGKEDWIWEDTRYGSAGDNPMVKVFVIDGKDCVISATSDVVCVHDAESGKLIRRCELHSDVRDIWYNGSVGAVLECGELASIVPSDSRYVVNEAYHINIEQIRRVENSFRKESLTFVVDDEKTLTIYAEGWGDESFVFLGRNATPKRVCGLCLHGELAAVILRDEADDTFTLVMIDTKKKVEKWRKALPEELYKGVLRDFGTEFVDEGSRLMIRNNGLPTEGMAVFYFAVEDGAEERVPVEGIGDIDLNSVRFTRIGGMTAYYASVKDENQFRICRILSGKPEYHTLKLESEGYTIRSIENSSDDGRYLPISVERNGTVDFLIYDLEKDTFRVLEEVSSQPNENNVIYTVVFSEENVIVSDYERGISLIYDISGGKLLTKLEHKESTVVSISSHGDSIYLFGFDGYVRRYGIKDGKLKNSTRIRESLSVADSAKWYYEEDSVILDFEDDSFNRNAYVMDEEELVITDRIGDFAGYIPATKTFLINDPSMAFGMFGRHTMDELIEMGYAQLGEH